MKFSEIREYFLNCLTENNGMWMEMSKVLRHYIILDEVLNSQANR